jgi:MraZ protein
MFLGQFEHSVDEKGRITVPFRYRGQLAEGLVVTKSIEACLLLYPLDAWHEFRQKIGTLLMSDPNARAFRRDVFPSAFDVVPDKQGRFILPQHLRQYANIDKQAVIIGLDDHCEIWNPDSWRQWQQENDSNPDARTERFASLNI